MTISNAAAMASTANLQSEIKTLKATSISTATQTEYLDKSISEETSTFSTGTQTECSDQTTSEEIKEDSTILENPKKLDIRLILESATEKEI